MIKSISLSFLFALFLSPALSAKGEGEIALIFSNGLDYPIEGLVVSDITEKERLIDGAVILAAWKVSGKLEKSFYPIYISITGLGEVFDQAEKDLLMEQSIQFEGAENPLGTINLNPSGAGNYGALNMGFRNGKRIVYGVASFPDLNHDVKIAVETAFSPDQLVDSPGGEIYKSRMMGAAAFDRKRFFSDALSMVSAIDLGDTVSKPAPLKSSESLHVGALESPAYLQDHSGDVRRYGMAQQIAIIVSVVAILVFSIFFVNFVRKRSRNGAK